MKKIKKLHFIFLLYFFTQQVEGSEQSIIGYWLTSESIVEIKYCGDLLCGQIKTIFVEKGIDPNTVLDSNNIKTELRSRPLIGINLLEGFNKELGSNSILKGGQIYNPRDGKTYKSKLELLDNGNMRVEGCILFICDGEDWQPMIVTLNPDGTHTAKLKNIP